MFTLLDFFNYLIMLDAFFIIHCVISILLIISIMLQRSGASVFGSLGNSSSGIISTQMANKFMVKTTFVLIGLFMINCLILGNLINKSEQSYRKIDSVKELKSENTSIPLAK